MNSEFLHYACVLISIHLADRCQFHDFKIVNVRKYGNDTKHQLKHNILVVTTQNNISKHNILIATQHKIPI